MATAADKVGAKGGTSIGDKRLVIWMAADLPSVR